METNKDADKKRLMLEYMLRKTSEYRCKSINNHMKQT